MVDQQVKTYKNQKEMQHGINHMARQGYHVASSTTGNYRKASFLGWVLFGLFNLFRKSKARHITVVFVR